MAFPDKIALGKKEYKYDPRTVVMGALLVAPPEQEPPAKYDYDHGKSKFPLDVWGNDANGDCVFVSEANGLVRLERAESHRTVSVTTDVVLGKYRSLTGSKSPGDDKDHGYIVLDALKDWRNNGWPVGKKSYKIDAYGELDKNDCNELRRAIWLLGGIYTGFSLPRFASELVSQGKTTWDVQDGPGAAPGSWGGHAMFSKRYDEGGVYFLTWGEEVYLTNAFVARYCDEAWAVVDALDGHSAHLNVPALEKILHGIASSVN